MASYFLIFLLILSFNYVYINGLDIPEHFRGSYYSISKIQNFYSVMDSNMLRIERDASKQESDKPDQKKLVMTGVIKGFRKINETTDAQGNFDAYVLFFDKNSGCYVCYQMLHRTINIIQYRQSLCVTGANKNNLEYVCNSISTNVALETLFRTDIRKVNCKSSFEGIYHYTYEIRTGGGGPCNSPRSILTACQQPGSVYVDNEVMNMDQGKCKDIGESENKKIQYKCLGSWTGENGHEYSTFADIAHNNERDRFKCSITQYDQQLFNNQRWHGFSRFPTCANLLTVYESPIRYLMRPVIGEMQITKPGCNLPRNFTGRWFTTGEFDTVVQINSTHIYFKTTLDQFTFKETYFICMQNRDSRYLMNVITIGKCEIDYVCFDMMPRHHNIIRWRMGRPYRQRPGEEANTNFIHKKFRQACTWSSFTIDRENYAWKYHTFILDPPSPIDCPIGGRYSFVQVGAQAEHYYTRVQGITERPRHKIGCKSFTTEFKSCTFNPKKIFIDAEYCNDVDHTARPIGEYDEPDRELACVGYWMEDMKSYLITYDEEDPVSRYRCWIYERLDWRVMAISRGTRAICGDLQTAMSYKPEEGASLLLKLQEMERDYDDCPQRYDTGANPYEKQAKIFVLASAHHVTPTFTLVTSCLTVLLLSLFYV